MSLKKLDESKYSVPTQLIYGKSLTGEWDYSHHVIPPITASSSFRLGSTTRGAAGFEAFGQTRDENSGESPIYVYERLGEPNNDMLQNALAVAEQSECAVTFSTGMAAVHAAVCFALNPGSEVVAHKTVYGCTYSLFSDWLPRFGIPVRFCDLTKIENIDQVLTEKTRILYLESPANPTLELLDLEKISQRIQQINATRPIENRVITVIDNTFSTPFCQRPIKSGIDVVVHSLTKGISGFGVDLGGAVVTRREFMERLVLFRKDFGCMLSPKTAWNILVYGISTLALRIPKQQSNALILARYLESHPAVARVIYPGLESYPQREIALRLLRDYEGNFAPGFMIYFSLRGKSPEEAKLLSAKLMDHIAQNAYSMTLAVSLGHLRTLIEHPGSMTHSAYPADEQLRRGMDPSGIRLAVGIESVEDLIKDLSAALKATCG